MVVSSCDQASRRTTHDPDQSNRAEDIHKSMRGQPWDRTSITVAELRQSAEELLQHLEEVEGETIYFDKDYFWAILPEQKWNPSTQPSEFTVGQLSECVENIRRSLRRPDLHISYELVWLAEILSAAGSQTMR